MRSATRHQFRRAPAAQPAGERLIPYLNRVRLDGAFEMEFGNAYLFNNRCLHQVRHPGQDDRTNEFLDFLPAEHLGLTATQLEERQPQTERERACLSMA